MLKYQNVKYEINKKINDSELLEYAKSYIVKKLKLNNNDIKNIYFLKKSIDARKKLMYVLSVAFSCNPHIEENILEKIKDNSCIERYQPFKLTIPYCLRKKRYLVVGMGPSGLFNALILAKGGLDVTIIERGKRVEERILDVEKFFSTGVLNNSSNVQFGEGGAGTFSDGKLNTGNPNNLTNEVLRMFVEFGANSNILYESKPHIGTDVLRKVVKNIRLELEKLGVKVYFETKLIDIKRKDNLMYVDFESSTLNSQFFDGVILAIGHSAHDTYQLLDNIKVALKPKPFALGVRIEHHQSLINESLYHEKYNFLEPASYKLVTHLPSNRAAYTFCMCPGGFVVNASSENGYLVVNGMSNHLRDEKNANSAILIEIKPSDYYKDSPLDGLLYQKNLEKKAFDITKDYRAPIQLFKDFKNGHKTTKIGLVEPTIKPGYVLADLNEILPKWLCDDLKLAITSFAKKIPNFDLDDAVLTAVETRSSSPIQIVRDKNFNASIKGIYPIGEGAGYSGGIMTSAVDGIKCALKIIEEVNNE